MVRDFARNAVIPLIRHQAERLQGFMYWKNEVLSPLSEGNNIVSEGIPTKQVICSKGDSNHAPMSHSDGESQRNRMEPREDRSSSPSTPSSSSQSLSPTSRSSSSTSTILPGNEKITCVKCGLEIYDRYLLKVNNDIWHAHCMKCSICKVSLSQHTSCFIKEKDVFCRKDYYIKFGTSCSRCQRRIQANDWVRRAKGNIYHLACFACCSCKRQLSTGEEFGLVEEKVLCRTHYDTMIENLKRAAESGNGMTLEGAVPTELDSQPKPAKRARTSFTAEQLQIMQAQFAQDNNPDAQTLQKLADMTGLSRRVIQVWFQNCRARHKKHTPQHSGAPQCPVPRMASLPEDLRFSPFNTPERARMVSLNGYIDSHPFNILTPHLHQEIMMSQLPLSR